MTRVGKPGDVSGKRANNSALYLHRLTKTRHMHGLVSVISAPRIGDEAWLSVKHGPDWTQYQITTDSLHLWVINRHERRKHCLDSEGCFQRTLAATPIRKLYSSVSAFSAQTWNPRWLLPQSGSAVSGFQGYRQA